jgi:hypothetical protein
VPVADVAPAEQALWDKEVTGFPAQLGGLTVVAEVAEAITAEAVVAFAVAAMAVAVDPTTLAVSRAVPAQQVHVPAMAKSV